ncbi:MarR family winged helix-turn-helix transcriptional regulator [Dermatobacter hominis]|uniref:MarR family winged helix-turn-helix transcriptional regulator n=1 Tax=Dermatobacter hominis TaxID=2884263 RepID=UPI001D10DBAD|nr:MarR family winged helix-turn-helix transcriptional regulator [Dermatobacter hominis]UDY34188.1 MarR family winged helix-turn-helix transcriptional regulator [Dermatobacter hominis]
MPKRAVPPTADEPEPLPLDQDPALALQVLARQLATATMDDVRAAVPAPVRESDGYVFQHLLPGPLTVGELAERLGITQQGASKAVLDMDRRGLVVRSSDPTDRRIRRVGLTPAALGAVHAARRSRQAFADAVESTLGPRRAATFRRALLDLLAATGADAAVERRSVPAPD